MEEKHNWRYCVVGNIVQTRVDGNEKIWHGTAAFRGGAKVYLSGKNYEFDHEDDVIGMLGLTRGRRYQVVYASRKPVENLRVQRVWKPGILRFMDDREFWDCWWDDSEEDRMDAERFVDAWNEFRD